MDIQMSGPDADAVERLVARVLAGEDAVAVERPAGRTFGSGAGSVRRAGCSRAAEPAAAAGKVVGYVRRHMAQRPEGNVTETRWRKSLMNWGTIR